MNSSDVPSTPTESTAGISYSGSRRQKAGGGIPPGVHIKESGDHQLCCAPCCRYSLHPQPPRKKPGIRVRVRIHRSTVKYDVIPSMFVSHIHIHTSVFENLVCLVKKPTRSIVCCVCCVHGREERATLHALLRICHVCLKEEPIFFSVPSRPSAPVVLLFLLLLFHTLAAACTSHQITDVAYVSWTTP